MFKTKRRATKSSIGDREMRVLPSILDRIVNTKFIHKFFIFALSVLALSSCVSMDYTDTKEKQDYVTFRDSQYTFLSTDGEIRYIDKGQGPIILLIHGVPSSSWLYRKMIEGLVDGGYRVIAPDMLGFGNSANPDGYDVYSPKHHSRRILELMDSLNISKWAHVMHDAGGVWTWELAKQAPERISHLIILNTVIFEEGFNPPVRMDKGNTAKFAMYLYENRLTSAFLLDQLFQEGLSSGNLSKEAFNGYKIPLREGKTNGMYQFFTNTCNSLPQYDDTIKTLNLPVAVIWGKDDEILQWEPQKERVMASLNIKEKNVHVIDAGHFIQEDAPEIVNSHILHFLALN
jgi:pimeloyl-ACP methyl ester carboxylesterase